MLTAAFVTLAIAVLVGSLLGVLHMGEGEALPAWPLAALHGLTALAGLGLLALSLGGPARGADQGTGAFGAVAAAMFAMAVLVGAALFAARLRSRRPAGALIAIHAMIAVSGFVVLAAYYYAG